MTNYTSQRAFSEAVLSKAEALCNAAPDYPEYDGEFSGTPCANMRDNAIEFYDFARTGYPATLTALRALLPSKDECERIDAIKRDDPNRDASLSGAAYAACHALAICRIYPACLSINAALPEQERVDVPQ